MKLNFCAAIAAALLVGCVVSAQEPWYTWLPCQLNNGCVCNPWEPHFDLSPSRLQWYGTCTSCDAGWSGWNCLQIDKPCRNGGYRVNSSAPLPPGSDQPQSDGVCVCPDTWTGANCQSIQCINSVDGSGPSKVAPTSAVGHFCESCEDGWSGIACDACDADSVCPAGKVCHKGVGAAGDRFRMQCNLTGGLFNILQKQDDVYYTPGLVECKKPTTWANPAADGFCHVNVFLVWPAGSFYPQDPSTPWQNTFMYCDMFNCSMTVASDNSEAKFAGEPPALATGARLVITAYMYICSAMLGILGLFGPARWKQLYGGKLLIIIFVLACADVFVGVMFDHKSLANDGSEVTLSSVYTCAATTCKCGHYGCMSFVIGDDVLPLLTGQSIISCNQMTGKCSIVQSSMKYWSIELSNCTAASCIDEKDAPRDRGGSDQASSYAQAGGNPADSHGAGLKPAAGTRWQLLLVGALIGALASGALLHLIISVCCMARARRREFNDLVVNQFHDGYSNMSNQSISTPAISFPSVSAGYGSTDQISSNNNNSGSVEKNIDTAAAPGARKKHIKSSSAGAASSRSGGGAGSARGGGGGSSSSPKSGAVHMLGLGADTDHSLMTPTVLRLEDGTFDIPQSGINSLVNAAAVLRAKADPKTRASLADVATRKSASGGAAAAQAAAAAAAAAGASTHSPSARHHQHHHHHHHAAPRTRVLEGINLEIESGHSLALLGPSGAGKTTMLDLLAYHRKSGTVGGKLSLNGEMIDSSNAHTYRSIVGFVPQEDRLIEYLTVRQCIYHAARMRLPLPISDAQVVCLVDEVITELSLTECQHTVVGGKSLRGVSGGERRRVSIAVELVGLPRILILDEMTSGLDSLSARRVMQLVLRLPSTPLRSLARFGRFFCYKPIVIFSIHQPSADIYRLFDKVLVLVNGRAVVSGDSRTVLAQALAAASLSEADAIHSMNVVMGGQEGGGGGGEFFDTDAELAKRRHAEATASARAAAVAAPVAASSDEKDNNSSSSTSEPRTHFRLVNQSNNNNNNNNNANHSVVDSAPNPAELLLYVAAVFSTQTPSLNLRVITPTTTKPKPATTTSIAVQDDNDTMNENDSSSQRDPSRNVVVASGAAVQGPDGSVHQPLLTATAGALQMVSGVPPERIIEVTQRMQRFYPGFWHQLLFLGRRSRDAFIGMFSLTSCHMGAAVLLAGLFSYLYQDEALDLAGTEDKAGMITFLMLIVAFSSLSCLELLVSERLVFASDYDRGLYGAVPYFMVKIFFDFIPHRIIPTAILAVGTYFPMGLRLDGGIHFGIFFTVLQLFAVWNVSLCICVGIIFADFGSSALVSALIILWNTAFGGLMVQGTSIPKYLRPFKYLSPAFYAYEATLINELEGQQCSFNPATSTDGRTSVAVIVHCEEFLLNLGLDPSAFVRDMVCLSAGTLGFVVLATILVKISAEVRKTH